MGKVENKEVPEGTTATSKAKAPENKVAKPTVPAEQLIAVLGTRNEKFRKDVLKAATKHGVNVAELEDSLLDKSWLCRAKVKGNLEATRVAMSAFIVDDNTQRDANNRCLEILELMTNGEVPASEAGRIGFNQGALAKKCNRSHKQTAEILDSLERMGKLRWIDKKRNFVLIFDPEEGRKHVFDAMEHDLEVVKDIQTKYYALLAADKTLTPERRKELTKRVKDKVKEILL